MPGLSPASSRSTSPAPAPDLQPAAGPVPRSQAGPADAAPHRAAARAAAPPLEPRALPAGTDTGPVPCRGELPPASFEALPEAVHEVLAGNLPVEALAAMSLVSRHPGGPGRPYAVHHRLAALQRRSIDATTLDEVIAILREMPRAAAMPGRAELLSTLLLQIDRLAAREGPGQAGTRRAAALTWLAAVLQPPTAAWLHALETAAAALPAMERSDALSAAVRTLPSLQHALHEDDWLALLEAGGRQVAAGGAATELLATAQCLRQQADPSEYLEGEVFNTLLQANADRPPSLTHLALFNSLCEQAARLPPELHEQAHGLVVAEILRAPANLQGTLLELLNAYMGRLPAP